MDKQRKERRGITKNDTIYKVVTDHLGSVRMIVNAGTGQTVLKNTYDEWGNVIAQTVIPGWEDYDFGFAGGLYDSETGLTRFGARDFRSEAEIPPWRDPVCRRPKQPIRILPE